MGRSGRLVATVIFDWDTDLDIALVDVQKAVGSIEGEAEVDEVLVRRFDPRQSPILTLGLLAPSGNPGPGGTAPSRPTPGSRRRWNSFPASPRCA